MMACLITYNSTKPKRSGASQSHCFIPCHHVSYGGFLLTSVFWLIFQMSIRQSTTPLFVCNHMPICIIFITLLYKRCTFSILKCFIKPVDSERGLTLYAPCITLQYVYKPTRCTKFLWLDFIFSLDAPHYVSPSSGATL